MEPCRTHGEWFKRSVQRRTLDGSATSYRTTKSAWNAAQKVNSREVHSRLEERFRDNLDNLIQKLENDRDFGYESIKLSAIILRIRELL